MGTGARHLCQMSTSKTNVTSWDLFVIVTVQCSKREYANQEAEVTRNREGPSPTKFEALKS